MPPYNHNDHYRGLIIDQVPGHSASVLDVGCGEGRLAQDLARAGHRVIAIDPDAASIAAGRRSPADVHYVQADFMQHDFGGQRFDVVTAVASLHHLPLEDALRKMADLLQPAGRMAVLGLHKPASAVDHLLDLAAVPTNAVLARSRPSLPMAAPTTEPTTTLTAIRATAQAALPGSRTRRLLLWRYLLTWTKPR